MDEFEKYANTEYVIRSHMVQIHTLERERKETRVKEIAQGKFKERFLESNAIRRLIEYKLKQVQAIERLHNKNNPMGHISLVDDIVCHCDGFDECLKILGKQMDKSEQQEHKRIARRAVDYLIAKQESEKIEMTKQQEKEQIARWLEEYKKRDKLETQIPEEFRGKKPN